ELRTFLRNALPEYMVPTTVTALEALPLSANGKVDRRALATRERTGASSIDAGRTNPRDAEELALVQIFEEVLGECPVGVTDSFFELGGQSMTAVRVISRIRKRFGRALSLAALLRGPTVEALAVTLREEAAVSPATATTLVEIQPGGSRPPFFCVHP